jgi:hypothetical protein
MGKQAVKLKLQEGVEYRYADIMQSLEGGSEQFYLPHKGQHVFAALLTPLKNPDAPDVILVGSRRRVAIAGAIFSRQITPVPTFVKKATNRWQYRGMYIPTEVVGQSETAAMAKKAGRDDVAFALRLRKFQGEPAAQVFIEGACAQVTRNIYERDGEARAKCLQYLGRRCCVCSLDFEEEYQDRGRDFIHVHHLEPLSSRKGPSATEPLTELVPVCANCHAMLHAGGELITPEKLRDLYWSDGSSLARQTRLNAKHT